MQKKKRLIIVLSLLLIIALGIAGMLYYKSHQREQQLADMQITFRQDKLQLEYGAAVNAEELVEKASAPIASYPVIDTKKTGEQTIVFLLKKGELEKQVSHVITIRDTQAPVISLKKEEIVIRAGDGFDPRENITSVSDPVDGELPFSEKAQDGAYTITTDADSNTAGTYSVEVIAYDQTHHEARASYTLTVKVKELPNVNSGNQEPSNPVANSDIKPLYINGILLVNKNHPLPKSFGATDPTAYAALQKLQSSAGAAGYAMPFLSGFRSYEYQVGLYNYYVGRDGQAAADRYSARPGYSEHQSGLCFDIGSIDNNYGNTAAGKWLAQHAHEYGFIIRYPQGKEAITGYMYEPWHVRYVGVEAATVIFQQQLTLEEYLGVY